MLLALSTTLLVLTFLASDITMSMQLRFDLLSKAFRLKLLIFGVSIISLEGEVTRLDLRSRYIWLQVRGEDIGIALTTDPTNADSIINYISNPLAKFIDFKLFDLHITVGSKDDAFFTALAVQAVRSAVYAAIAMIKSSQELVTHESINPVFDRDAARADIFGIINMTPANIIFSFFYALAVKSRDAVRMARREH